MAAATAMMGVSGPGPAGNPRLVDTADAANRWGDDRPAAGPRRSGWSRLLLGDWHPLLRDPIDLVRLSFLGGAIALAVDGDAEWVRMGLTAVFLVFIRFLALPRPFDLSVNLGMALQAWGNVYSLFERTPDLILGVPYYGVLVHLFLPALTAPVGYILLARLRVVPDLSETSPHHYAGVFLITFSVMETFGGVLYELYEFTIDQVMNPASPFQHSLREVDVDFAADTLGSALGGVFLVVWARYGWGTTRRVAPPTESQR